MRNSINYIEEWETYFIWRILIKVSFKIFNADVALQIKYKILFENIFGDTLNIE